jgi:hypothetical protein
MYISIEPDHARPGDEVTVALEGPDTMGWIGGLYADFEAETPDGWKTILHLTGSRGGEYPPPIEPGRPRFQHSVGIKGPVRFQVPAVPPGSYRLRRDYVQPGPEVVALFGTIVIQ